MLQFEWNQRKSKKNRLDHGVSFEEAQSVFYDEYAIQFYDEEHSQTEDRFLMLGLSIEFNILVVVHCEREDGDVIRIISARKATKTERKHYTGNRR